jgi:hypothetical protein
MTSPCMREWILIVGLGLGCGLLAAGCGGVEVKATCTTSGECFPGYSCDLALTGTCVRACDASGGCLASEVCDIPGGSTAGVCRLPPGD